MNGTTMFGVRPALVLLVLLAVTLGLYIQVASFDFLVDWDDGLYIVGDPLVQAGLSWEGVVAAFTATAPFLMPLVRVSFMAQVSLFGSEPGGFHLVNLVFHLANIYLLYMTVCVLTGAPWKGVVLAAVLALHPQHVEAVAWITERKEVMSAFFGLISLWQYGRYARLVGTSPGKQDSTAKNALAWSLLAFMASLLCKPMWVTLPFLLLLLDFWPLNRLPVMGWQVVREKGLYFLVTLVFSLVTFATFTTDGALTAVDDFSWAHRLTKMITAYLGFLVKGLWPVDLAAYYPHPLTSVPVGRLWAIVVGLLAVTVWTWYQRGRQPYWLVGWLWFLGTIFPVSGIVEGGLPIAMADRWSYIPHIGLSLAIVWQVEDWTRRRVGIRRVIIGMFVLMLAWWSALTWHLVATWQDGGTLWARVVQIGTENGYAHWKLGRYYGQSGRHAEAVAEYARAVLRNPGIPEYHVGLWSSLRQVGREEEAEAELTMLRKILQGNDRYLARSGDLLLREKNFSQAILFFKDALAGKGEKAAQQAGANHFHAALAFYAAGREAEGEGHLQEIFSGEEKQVAARCKIALGYFEKGEDKPKEFYPMLPVVKKYCNGGLKGPMEG